MDVREYVSVRRAYNLVRQDIPAGSRLTFEEASILALLDVGHTAWPTSDIASWQHALRPTMTHRANHLASLGLIERTPGIDDRRNVICNISASGIDQLDAICAGVCKKLAQGKVLSRVDAQRVKRYLHAMGQQHIPASDLVLLGLSLCDGGGEGIPISLLVGALGLLQPTVSMSVQALDEKGLVERDMRGMRSARVRLTDQGLMEAERLNMLVEDMVVRRKRRSRKADSQA